MTNSLTIILCFLTVGAVYSSFGIPGATNDSSKVEKQNEPDALQIYSDYVKDTFHIKIHVPESYSRQDTLPVAYLLDGDFFGRLLSVGMRQMNLAGKLPPLILVSVGYNSIEKMDSLRVRDYLYPATIPSDEMEAPGGGKKFLDFLEKELTP